MVRSLFPLSLSLGRILPLEPLEIVYMCLLSHHWCFKHNVCIIIPIQEEWEYPLSQYYERWTALRPPAYTLCSSSHLFKK